MTKRITTLFFLAAILVSSCAKEDPIIPNEEELITTLNYILTPVGGGNAVTFSYKDLDGDGGNDPVIVNGTLEANKTYTGKIELLNEQEVPADDIASEVLTEGVDHQLFYVSTTNGVVVSYKDQDANGNPIGLSTELQTAGAGTGKLTIFLRHEPNKTAVGVSSGDVTNAGGETDIEVTFDMNVQ